MKIIFKITTAILLIGSFGIATPLVAEQKKSQEKQQFFEFNLSDKERENLLNGLKQIKQHDTLDRVKKILGTPSLEDEILNKQGEFLYYLTTYYIRQVEKENVNMKDEMVYIFFDKNKEVIKVQKVCSC